LSHRASGGGERGPRWNRQRPPDPIRDRLLKDDAAIPLVRTRCQRRAIMKQMHDSKGRRNGPIASATAAVRIAVIAGIVAGALGTHTACASDDLPRYQKVGGVSGTSNFIGSDTMINLMSLWGEAFQQKYPSVRVQGEGKGSSTAPPALIAGTA